MAGSAEALASAEAERPDAAFGKLKPGPGQPADEVAEHQRARIRSAVLEVVARRGYDAVTVREVARVAGVSSRSFYQHYSCKEECFLSTHELVVRRLVQHLVTAQAGAGDWRERLRLTIDAFLGAVVREPRGARLMLAEAYFAGPAVLEQVRRAERTLEARIIDCFDRAPDRGQVSPLLAKGIVAGLICIARSRLLSGRKDELPLLSRDLSDWALSLHSAFLCPLERSTDGVEQTPLLSPLVFLGIDVEATGAPMGDRALILSALAKLAVQQGYDQLTVRAIRESAGVSSGCFSTHFSGVEACFLEAVDRYIDYLIEHAAAARSGGVSSQDGISHAIQSVCALASSERAVAKLCFVEILSPGPSGVRAFERFVDRMIGLAEMDGEPLHSSGRTRAEASASAIWGILRDEIIGERSPEPQHLAELLTLFATASVDPRFTAGATAEEIENTGIENLIAAS